MAETNISEVAHPCRCFSLLREDKRAHSPLVILIIASYIMMGVIIIGPLS